MTTLQSLYDFIQIPENKKLLSFNNLDSNPILTYYLITKESYSKGHFYLGGQIKLKPDDIIRKEHIKWVQKINKERTHHDYANYWEYSSCMTHERTFNDFVKLYDFFEEYRKKTP
jgi:hypothetical protein